MLKDTAFNVSKRKCKKSMGKMFCIESALVKKTILKWFNKKIKQTFAELSPIKKLRYEKQNPVNRETDKCVICQLALKIEPTRFKTPDDEMSFGDFLIRYGHKFLRNIYTNEQINDSYHLKDLENYYEIFEEYKEICVGLLALLNNFNRNGFINSAVENFVNDNFYGDEIKEIKNTFAQTEIKNALSTSFGKVSKFNLTIYAYVYDNLINFPRSDIDYETITTNKFFINIHRLIKVKFHLHHLHITGKIQGYAHDFCNTAVIEKTMPDIPFTVHSYLVLTCIILLRLTLHMLGVLNLDVLNIGGTNFIQVNFGNIAGEIKLIDTLKFYQKSLADIASTLSDEEMVAVKKIIEKFLNEHYYFFYYLAISKFFKKGKKIGYYC